MQRDTREGFEFRGNDNYLALTVQRVFDLMHQTPALDEFHILTKIDIKCSGFSASNTALISSASYRAFFKNLQVNYAKLDGTASLTSYGNDFHLRLSVNSSGQVLVDGMTSVGAGTFNGQNVDCKLKFGLLGNQSSIKGVLEGLHDINRLFER
ncbi:WapI family immunity protein [Flaviaesturariibacter aridisoli]|uniref:Uncharacterized protein n=1 Tax=Flaviaesturariibacter aridisoli TaxID=2545761 RepID=A0A4V2WMG1_9BACT|nr:hypothetical protein [Flaviaesturariibacter aridisoli]TCZ68861.1 hypothetical protein E0486_13360 [Flaviaesturariibacter aridisoli]